MLPPFFHNKVKKGLNPDVKTSYRSGGGGGGGGGLVDFLIQKLTRFKKHFSVQIIKKSFRARDQ